jgi:hypothetical protein
MTKRRSPPKADSVLASAPMDSPVAVLIVVGGPVGLALAGDLGWRGIRCLLIEQSDGTFISLDEPEVAEMYQRRLVLVRPDGHVAWRDDRAPANPLAVIDRVRGAAGAASSASPHAMAASA